MLIPASSSNVNILEPRHLRKLMTLSLGSRAAVPGKVKSKVVLIGGSDVDSRISLVSILSEHFDIAVFGTSEALGKTFSEAGIRYDSYAMDRGADPFTSLRSILALAELLRVYRPDIVHTFDTKPSIIGRMAARIAQTRVIIATLPGRGSLYLRGTGARRQILRYMYEGAQFLSSRLSDATIFQNQDDLREFVTRRIVQIGRAHV